MSTEKMQKDFSEQIASQLPNIQQLVRDGRVTEALEQLLVLEKLTRVGADLSSNTKVLQEIVAACYDTQNLTLMNENVTMLAKKHGLLKQAVTKMVQQVMQYIDQISDKTQKMTVIQTLLTVTDGKIFLEVERARLTRTLTAIKEEEGKISEAADILHDLQVETFGLMERREKTDFILEQMRLMLAKGDYTRTQVLSKKISTKFFTEEENTDLKLRFYNLMIQYGVHEGQYLEVCKYYRQIYDTKSIQADEMKWQDILKKIVIFVILAPHDNEQHDLLNRVKDEPNLNKIPTFRDFIKCFITNELMRWPKMQEIYNGILRDDFVFQAGTEGGEARWKDFHKRVIEHNIRVVAKYYERITTSRLTQLLDLTVSETEEFLSNLVVNKTIYARIDRPANIVTFRQPQDSNIILNEWSSNINSLLDLIVKTTHAINKEEMVHASGLAKVI